MGFFLIVRFCTILGCRAIPKGCELLLAPGFCKPLADHDETAALGLKDNNECHNERLIKWVMGVGLSLSVCFV